MNNQTIVIDGEKFSDLETFYSEIDNLLTEDLEWQTGHNLAAFNDLLYGGFGVYEYEDAVKIIWINASKSRNDLGYSLFEKLIEIIKDHDHIEFFLAE